MGTDAILEIRDLDVTLGSSQILHGISETIDDRPLGLLGRNGMGKTTLCAAIMGLVPVSGGRIVFCGKDITTFTPEARVQAGIGYVPQGRRIFRSLSVHEHLQLVAPSNGSASWTIERIYETFPRLAERRKNLGDRLSGGEQQMLAISRAMLLNPTLLVLDEPTEGLAPAIVSDVIDLICQLSDDGMAILLVEQNIHAAFAATKRVSVMVNGVMVQSLAAGELEADAALQRKYFGLEPGQAAEEEESCL